MNKYEVMHIWTGDIWTVRAPDALKAAHVVSDVVDMDEVLTQYDPTLVIIGERSVSYNGYAAIRKEGESYA